MMIVPNCIQVYNQFPNKDRCNIFSFLISQMHEDYLTTDAWLAKVTHKVIQSFTAAVRHFRRF